jgi:hypothetical protein
MGHSGAPAALPSGKRLRYPLDVRSHGYQSQSRRLGNEKLLLHFRESNSDSSFAHPTSWSLYQLIYSWPQFVGQDASFCKYGVAELSAPVRELFFVLEGGVCKWTGKRMVQIYVVLLRIVRALMCGVGMRKMYPGEETSWLDGVPFIVCCSRCAVSISNTHLYSCGIRLAVQSLTQTLHLIKLGCFLWFKNGVRCVYACFKTSEPASLFWNVTPR